MLGVRKRAYEDHVCIITIFMLNAYRILQGFLTEDALTEVQALLPEYADGELAAVCSWPDEFRKLMPWSTALHFVDRPDSSCNYEYCSKFAILLSSTCKFVILSIEVYTARNGVCQFSIHM